MTTLVILVATSEMWMFEGMGGGGGGTLLKATGRKRIV